jgi:iron complex transport system substrate-binding protein
VNPPRPDVRTSRRTFLAAGLATATGALLAGASRSAARTPPGSAPATASDGAEQFPLTIEHIYGTTTIPSRPQRVVTAGFNDADFALAVGVVPVGVANFIGSFDEEARPWAQDALGGAQPEVVTNDAGELLLERIAALEPDVIVYYSYLQEADYARLSELAPTVVEPAPGTLWQQHTLDVGRALGRSAEAEAIVAEVEARFAAERAAHPEFAGTTAAILFGVDVGTNYYVLEPVDPRVGLFVSLGFEMPETTGEISAENALLLDQELIVVVGTEQEVMEADPLFSSLAAVREGRVAFLGGFDGQFAGALGFDSPLSLPAALDVAVPQLARALGGS